MLLEKVNRLAIIGNFKMNNENKLLTNIASNMATQIGNLSIQIAQLQVENNQLKARNEELKNQNERLRKVGDKNESIRNNAGN